MDQRIAKITDSEILILKAFWANSHELTVNELVAAMSLDCDWNRSTIKTLVRRLIDKKIVTCIQRDVQYFSPLITEQQYRDHQTSKLIDQEYHGKASKLIASLYEHRKLDPDDIKELRRLLEYGDRNE